MPRWRPALCGQPKFAHSGLSAKAGREVHDGADRRIFVTILEPKETKRRIAVGNADAEAKLVAKRSAIRARATRPPRIPIASRTARSQVGAGSLKRTIRPSPARSASV